MIQYTMGLDSFVKTIFDFSNTQKHMGTVKKTSHDGKHDEQNVAYNTENVI